MNSTAVFQYYNIWGCLGMLSLKCCSLCGVPGLQGYTRWCPCDWISILEFSSFGDWPKPLPEVVHVFVLLAGRIESKSQHIFRYLKSRQREGFGYQAKSIKVLTWHALQIICSRGPCRVGSSLTIAFAGFAVPMLQSIILTEREQTIRHPSKLI